MSLKTTSLLLFLAFLHLSGIYLFTRGFLLSRLALSSVTSCTSSPPACTLPPTHRKAVLLIIDALRFDFLSPNPPEPPSPYHHNVITLPQELTAKYPRNSFLFNAHADPPTTTLQRIKGIVTGSLPTFVDMGANFGGSSIAEDSIIKQLSLANKSIAFMGDDTWMSVFPTTFHPNMTHPFDSFNVEDLHTVDNGVIAHLFPLLTDSPHAKEWDFLIGHFLGLDHVGHRVGPDHPSMKAKQEQMNDVLTRVVDALDDDTVLVVMGDHGMDRKGDHGGDGDLEVSSAMWIYSKGPGLSIAEPSIPSQLMQYTRFPGAPKDHRWVQQIDLVPTLSLLLGLPIPFNNLGTVIPELFWRDPSGSDFGRAMGLNTRQIKEYLDTYRSSSAGGELNAVWNELQSSWSKATAYASQENVHLHVAFTRLALETCRSLWAQFSIGLMGFGLSILLLSVGVAWSLYQRIGRNVGDWDTWTARLMRNYLVAGAGGAVIGASAWMPMQALEPFKGISILQFGLFGAALGSGLVVLFSSKPQIQVSWPIVITVLHTVAFFSNSYTFWEDRILTFFLLSTLVPPFLAAFSAPTSHLRWHIFLYSVVFAVCVRLMAFSTVCREEQHPWCSVTYYAGGTVAEPPKLVLALVVPFCFFVPWVINRQLAISKSNNGVASIFLPYILPPTLLAGTVYWILEWIDSMEFVAVTVDFRLLRTVLGRTSMAAILIAGGLLWTLVPICLQIFTVTEPPSASEPQPKQKVTVFGFANAFGAPYLIFWCIALGLVWITTQLTGQIALGLAAVALLAHLEIVDGMRDAQALQHAFATDPSAALAVLQVQGTQSAAATLTPSTSNLTFDHAVPLALLALHTFYTTGHQSTISSIQWKSSFVLTSTVTYPWSPALAALNTFGPVFLLALAAPLLALWNVPPIAPSGPAAGAKHTALVLRGAVRAGVAVMLYFGLLLVGSALSAAWLRRHLMVWKVFAPRYMAGAAQVLVVDLAVLLGVFVGVRRVLARIGAMFGEGRRKDE